jgi:hypothetical protein
MKLFSFEDETTQNVEALDSADTLESDVNEIVVEAEKEHPDEEIETINEAVEAGNDLEKVEDFVEAQEQKGGMDEDTAEAVRLAVEAIAHRVGYNPKRIYQLYATESFATSSSRKVNTQLAMEGIKEFLKSLWEKVKAVTVRIWTNIKEFWDKHFVTVSQFVKRLEALNEKIESSSGVYKDPSNKVVKAPSSVARGFAVAGNTTIKASNVKNFVVKAKAFIETIRNRIDGGMQNNLEALYKATVDSVEQLKASFSQAEKIATKKEAKEAISNIKEATETYLGGSEEKRNFNINVVKLSLGVKNFNGERAVILSDIVGGKKLVVEADESKASISLVTEEGATSEEAELVIPGKKELVDLNNGMIEMLNTYIYIKDNVNKVNELVKQYVDRINETIENSLKEMFDSEVGKKVESKVRKLANRVSGRLSVINSFYSSILKVTKTIGTDTARYGIYYINFCLEQYAPAEQEVPAV